MMLRLVTLYLCGAWLLPYSAVVGQVPWTTRRNRSTPQASFASERDPLLYNMFEVLISSLDDKFRRVDTIERAVHMIMRHMEIMDSKLQKSNNISVAVLDRMESLERRLARCTSSSRSSSEPAPPPQDVIQDGLQRNLASVESHVSRLQRTLDGLEVSMVAAEATPPTRPPTTTRRPAQVKRITRQRGSETLDVSQRFIKDAEKMTQTINELRGKVVSMDNKLSFHMGQMSDSLSSIIKSVTTVSTVLVEPASNNRTAARSRFDVLINKISPLMEVSSKMDEVWNVVVGTKSSVDDLGPKSDELLHTSNRQERAINSIQNDLQTTTRQIIANIGMVEQKLNRQALQDSVAAAYHIIEADEDEQDDEDHLRAAGSAFLGRTAETSKRFIRPVTLPTRASSVTLPSVTRLDKEAPFDILDKEFLEAYDNFTATSTTTHNPVLNAQGRGRPKGIVFPGRAAPTETAFAFLETTPNDQNVGQAYSCEDFRENGMNKSGIYYLRIHGTTYWYLKVFCDMEIDGGGWTVIQRRDDYGVQDQQNFNQSWEDYKQGFGDPIRSFWLGNENIFMLTNMEGYQLRVEIEDFDGEKRYAQYDDFKMHGESDNYKLEIDGYSGDAGDSMNDPWYGSNLSPFSTYDRDNDRSSLNCANMLKGGWWWRSCGRGLNGLYLTDPNDPIARQGIVWYRWRGWDYSLRRSVMMIRPQRKAKIEDADPN